MNLCVLFLALRLGDPCTTLDDCIVVSNSQCDTGRGGVCLCTEEYPIDGGNICGQGIYRHIFLLENNENNVLNDY